MKTEDPSKIIGLLYSSALKELNTLPEYLTSTLVWDWEIWVPKQSNFGISIKCEYHLGYREEQEKPPGFIEALAPYGYIEIKTSRLLNDFAESKVEILRKAVPKDCNSIIGLSAWGHELRGSFRPTIILGKDTDLHKEWLELVNAQHTLNGVRTLFTKELKSFADKLSVDGTPAKQVGLTEDLVSSMKKTVKKAERQLELAKALNVPEKLKAFYEHILESFGIADKPGKKKVPLSV